MITVCGPSLVQAVLSCFTCADHKFMPLLGGVCVWVDEDMDSLHVAATDGKILAEHIVPSIIALDVRHPCPVRMTRGWDGRIVLPVKGHDGILATMVRGMARAASRASPSIYHTMLDRRGLTVQSDSIRVELVAMKACGRFPDYRSNMVEMSAAPMPIGAVGFSLSYLAKLERATRTYQNPTTARSCRFGVTARGGLMVTRLAEFGYCPRVLLMPITLGKAGEQR